MVYLVYQLIDYSKRRLIAGRSSLLHDRSSPARAYVQPSSHEGVGLDRDRKSGIVGTFYRGTIPPDFRPTPKWENVHLITFFERFNFYTLGKFFHIIIL